MNRQMLDMLNENLQQGAYPADAAESHSVCDGLDIHHLVTPLLCSDFHNEIAQFGHILVVKLLVTVPGTARDRSVRFNVK